MRISDWSSDVCSSDLIAIPTLSRERLKALISSGNVSDDSGRLWRDPAVKAQPGQILRVAVPAPVPADAAPQAIPLHLVLEDRDLLVVDKPAGPVVHPACGTLDGTLVKALLHHSIGRGACRERGILLV